MNLSLRVKESPRDPRSSNYIPTLDGWRGIAISGVLICHGLHFYGPPDLVAPRLRLLNYALVRSGTFGVALFFAISGFLICSLLLAERENTGRISLRSFYTRRAFRILPPAFTYLLALAVLAWLGLIHLQRGELASAAFFYSNYWTDKSWFTDHFWSLSLEEHFYFLWPGLLAFLGNKRAAICAVAVMIATPIIRPLAIAGLSGSDLTWALAKTPMRLESFMVACLIAILLRNPGVRKRFIGLFPTSTWLFMIVLLALVIVSAERLSRIFIDARSIEAALLALLVATTTLRPYDLAGRILEWRPLRFIGRISYSVYLWQELVLQPVQQPDLIANLGWLIIKVAVVIALALLSYKFIEQPAMRFGRRIAEQTRTRFAATLPSES